MDLAATEPIVREMRHGNLSHLDAYSEFHRIWKKPEILGMGAAYFTKLIFFCEPNHKGYIMDQWVAKSINLLTDSNLVHLEGGCVSKRNTRETYAEFCAAIEKIGEQSELNGEETEIALFSKGGHKKWAWRDYVVKEYTNSRLVH